MNPPNRFKQHAADKTWWSEVSNVRFESFQTREELVAAEKHAIKSEKPRYNVVHNNLYRFQCGMCSRKLGKAATHVLLENDAIVCIDCVIHRGREAHTKFYPECASPWHDLNDHSIRHATYAAARNLLLASTTGEVRREQIEIGPEMPQKNTLIGKFFHTRSKCECGRDVADWQGQIHSIFSDDLLLIETYEWGFGQPNGQEFIALLDFIGKRPILYETSDQMSYSYQHGRLRHSGRNDRCYQNENEQLPQLDLPEVEAR